MLSTLHFRAPRNDTLHVEEASLSSASFFPPNNFYSISSSIYAHISIFLSLSPSFLHRLVETRWTRRIGEGRNGASQGLMVAGMMPSSSPLSFLFAPTLSFHARSSTFVGPRRRHRLSVLENEELIPGLNHRTEKGGWKGKKGTNLPSLLFFFFFPLPSFLWHEGRFSGRENTFELRIWIRKKRNGGNLPCESMSNIYV